MITNSIGIPNDTILICISYTPDKRGRFYKRMTKEGQIKEFRPLDKNGLRRFVKQHTEDIVIDTPALEAFLKKV
jgi:DNA polymerase III delta subunit